MSHRPQLPVPSAGPSSSRIIPLAVHVLRSSCVHSPICISLSPFVFVSSSLPWKCFPYRRLCRYLPSVTLASRPSFSASLLLSHTSSFSLSSTCSSTWQNIPFYHNYIYIRVARWCVPDFKTVIPTASPEVLLPNTIVPQVRPRKLYLVYRW